MSLLVFKMTPFQTLIEFQNDLKMLLGYFINLQQQARSYFLLELKELRSQDDGRPNSDQ
jgi:hypothetical protein